MSEQELNKEDVMALDKVQKKQTITEQEANRLRELKLIAGWIPIFGLLLKTDLKTYLIPNTRN